MDNRATKGKTVRKPGKKIKEVKTKLYTKKKIEASPKARRKKGEEDPQQKQKKGKRRKERGRNPFFHGKADTDNETVDITKRKR